jgi:hypothetical protein
LSGLVYPAAKVGSSVVSPGCSGLRDFLGFISDLISDFGGRPGPLPFAIVSRSKDSIAEAICSRSKRSLLITSSISKHSPSVLCTVFAIYANEAAAVMSFDLATAQS